MAKTLAEKRMSIEEQIKQLENERKKVMQKERAEKDKARTHRLCKRGGIAEKLLPELALLTDEQFDIFVNKVLLSSQTKRLISELSAQNTPAPTETQEAIPTTKGEDESETVTVETEQGED